MALLGEQYDHSIKEMMQQQSVSKYYLQTLMVF